MSIGFPLNQNAYSQSAGITPINHTVLFTVDPGPATIQSSSGIYQPGQFLLNISNGNLWYLRGYTAFNGAMSANWVLITASGSSSTFTNVIITGTLNVTGLTTLGALTQSGALNMNTSATPQTTNIATGAAVQTVTIGSTNTTSSISLVAGTASLSGSSSAGGFSLVGSLGVTNKVTFGIPGGGLNFAEGVNGCSGVATLAGGTVTISTNAVATTSRIELSRQSINGSTALGSLSVGTVSAGTSFVIRAVDPGTPANLIAGDTSIVYWQIIQSF
jgi:hypothetical protein